MAIKRNMGKKDRFTRGMMGAYLLAGSLLDRKRFMPIRVAQAGLGGALLIYGITGFDPFLKLFGASTLSGAEDNVINQLKQIFPGQGINPALTQQAVPQKKTYGINLAKTIADSLAIK